MKKFWTAVLAVIAADQLVKWIMLGPAGIATRPPLEVTPFLKLVMVWNQGVSFGMLSKDTAFLPWMLIAIALAISFWLYRLARESNAPFERLAYGLIIGGALGNVIDRLRFQAVADFFYFHIGDYYWPAFNIADAAICLGVAGLIFLMVWPRAKP